MLQLDVPMRLIIQKSYRNNDTENLESFLWKYLNPEFGRPGADKNFLRNLNFFNLFWKKGRIIYCLTHSPSQKDVAGDGGIFLFGRRGKKAFDFFGLRLLLGLRW
jgi:hypothetical protein